LEWNKWKIQLERFFKFEPKYAEDEEAKLNALLALGGAELEELYKLTPKTKTEVKLEKFPNAPIVKKEYTWAISRLDKHFEAGSNIQLEMSKFGEMKQSSEERFEQYVIRLKAQAEYCEFGSKEEAQIIHQINKSARLGKVRTKALEPGVNLIKLAAYAAQQEVVANSLEIEKNGKNDMSNENISHIGINKVKPNWNARNEKGQKDFQCYRCGSRKHTANMKNCPAINQRCNNCQRYGHFARACKGRFVGPKKELKSGGRNEARSTDVAHVAETNEV
jgi:hypothetical protein